MHIRKTTLSLALLTVCVAAPTPAQQPRVVGEKASVVDVLQFLGIHAWKWRVRGPLRGVRADVSQYVRDARGQFQRTSSLGSLGTGAREKMGDVEIAFLLQEQGDTTSVQLALQSVRASPLRFSSRLFAGYVKHGGGSGGTGLKIGDEYILLAKYNNPRVVPGKKKDMAAYVSVKISASR